MRLLINLASTNQFRCIYSFSCKGGITGSFSFFLNSDKPEITNYKHQITNKFQIYNIQISNKIKNQLFGILNFSHCDLFVICFFWLL